MGKDKNENLYFLFPNVSSLFTNIPPQETTDIAINLKKEIKKLFLFATSETHFLFNSKFYNQIDGVAMSSHLTLVLVPIIMGFYKSIW